MPVAAAPTEARFFRHVEKDGDCWTWTAHKTHAGYGRFWRSEGAIQAHRWSFEYFRAEIPEGLQLDHLCRNRACVNPWHLEPVTPRINTMRGDTVAARNAHRHECKTGHPLSGSNLYVDPRGKRECRTCRVAAAARYRAAKAIRRTEGDAR